MVHRWGWLVTIVALVFTGFSASPDATAAGVPVGPSEPTAESGTLLLVAEGNRLRRIDIDTIGADQQVEDVLVQRAGPDPEDRDINGQICGLPGTDGAFVAGEDTGQPHPPPGWGVFDKTGHQIGKLTASYFVAGAEPHGCAVAPDGSLFTAEVGFQGFGTSNGQLIQWFGPFDTFPGPQGAYPATDERSTNFCKLATDLGTAGGVAVDAEGRVYVAESSGFRIDRFSPPFPTGPDAAGGCGGVDSTGAPVATTVARETFAVASDGLFTFSGVAVAPNGNIYGSSVLTGRIAEYDLDGNVVRLILAPDAPVPPIPTGNPQDITVGPDGTIYYADLDLVGTLPDVSPGPNGKVWRIRFGADGTPRPPEIVRQGLAFPDGVAVVDGDLELGPAPALEWPTLAGGDRRRFFNPNEQYLTPDTAPDLIERWRFETDAVVTSSPSVATVALPDGPRRVVFVSSWDRNLSALDWATGQPIWQFQWEDQPGASFPGAGSPTVADVDGDRLVIFGAGEYVYALDAATGAERWRFAAGTGCRDAATGEPPGLCRFSGERNQVESTPIVADGVVYFGMDVNDVATGKGGFYALDAPTGVLRWYFDPESGGVCRPDGPSETGAGDAIRRFDGYHSEIELGLPTAFFSTRTGCDHPRTRNGCGNIWSSAALDRERGLLFFGTSNCDTDTNPATSVPPPPMPAYDEALVALRLDGSPAWRWRPREVDNDDLAFGATPNLFTISVNGRARDVVGIGNKDGTYYVLDRTGINARSGLRWDAPSPRALPYWERNVVPGGAIGGIIATASVDEATRRVIFSTAPGEDVLNPQRPTVHALDLDTGAVLWQNTDAVGLTGDASYGPTSGVPGLVMVGSVITPHLRFLNAVTGELVADHPIRAQGTYSGVASGPAVVDGTLVVGAGIGARSSGGSSPGDFAAYTPSAVVALCVPGAPGCVRPHLTPEFATTAEGDDGTTVLQIPIRLSEPVTQSVEVGFTTIDVEAGAGSDYEATEGTVVIPPGATVGYAEVPIIGDRLDETREERFVVSFRNPRHATLGGWFGVSLATITDDDPRPSVAVSHAIALETDADNTVLVPVTLSAPSGRTVTVKWRTRARTARSGQDFAAAQGTITIDAGDITASIPVTIVGDDRREGWEFFSVLLKAPRNARLEPFSSNAVVLIFDDD